jgi:hypothetical protein
MLMNLTLSVLSAEQTQKFPNHKASSFLNQSRVFGRGVGARVLHGG